MPITPDPTYSRIGLSLHLYLLGFKRLSLTYKSALRLSHPIHLRCIGSYLSLFLYPFTLFFLSTHPLLTLSFPLPPPEIIDLGWVFISPLYPLFLYCTLYTISSLLPVGCSTPTGFVYILSILFIYFYCIPTFTFLSIISLLYYLILYIYLFFYP